MVLEIDLIDAQLGYDNPRLPRIILPTTTGSADISTINSSLNGSFWITDGGVQNVGAGTKGGSFNLNSSGYINLTKVSGANIFNTIINNIGTEFYSIVSRFDNGAGSRGRASIGGTVGIGNGDVAQFYNTEPSVDTYMTLASSATGGGYCQYLDGVNLKIYTAGVCMKGDGDTTNNGAGYFADFYNHIVYLADDTYAINAQGDMRLQGNILDSTTNFISISPSGHTLYNNGGTLATVDYGSGILYYLMSGNYKSIDWNNGVIYSNVSPSTKSIDYVNGYFYRNGGNNKFADYGNGLIYSGDSVSEKMIDLRGTWNTTVTNSSSVAIGSNAYAGGSQSTCIGSLCSDSVSNSIYLSTYTSTAPVTIYGNTILSTEKLSNGNFVGNSTNWTLTTGWEYKPNGTITHNSNGVGTLSQPLANMTSPIIVGETYMVTFKIINNNFATPGALASVSAGGVSSDNIKGLNQTYNFIFTAMNNNPLSFTPGASPSRFDIANISMKKIISGNLGVANNEYLGGNFTGNQLYGEIWFHNDTNSNDTTMTQNTVYNISFSQNTQGKTLNGFTNSTHSNLQAQVQGRYKADYCITTSSSVGSHKYHFWISVNDTAQFNTENHGKLTNANDIIDTCGTGFIYLYQNDRVNLQVKDETAGGSTLSVYSANVNLVRIGN